TTGAAHVAPLLFTRISIAPKCAFVSSTTFLTSSGLETSQAKDNESTPSFFISSLISLQASNLREQMTALPPTSAYPFAICAPSPRAPPVTIAVFHSNLNKSSTFNIFHLVLLVRVQRGAE